MQEKKKKNVLKNSLGKSDTLSIALYNKTTNWTQN